MDKTINYSIRPLRQNETSLLKDFLYEAIFTPEGMETPSRDVVDLPELKLYIEHFGTKEDDFCLVADYEGKVIGAVWVRIMNDYGHIDNQTPSLAISLYKEYRNKGIGSRLMNEMIVLLKNKGYNRISLSVQKNNYAVNMYLKLGFRIIKETMEEFLMVNELNKEIDVDKYKIRSWSKDDFSTLAKYLNNKKIWDNCRDSLPYPYSENDAQQFILFVSSQNEQNNYCIEVNQEAAGNISFARGIDVERYNAELGYWLAEPYWGKGIMTQMLALAISCYFHQTDVMRIHANVYAGNIASMRVLEKTGFRKCGIHRNACFKNGVFTDCHYFELLKEEFRNLVK